MLISKVQWKDHPILGNLLLDFSTPSGGAYKTVVLAGENGAGKSSVLDTLSKFLNLGPITPFECIEYLVDGQLYKATPPTGWTTHPNFFERHEPDGQVARIVTDRSNSPETIDSDERDPRQSGCVYSKARSEYRTQKITSTSASALDVLKRDIDENDDFTSLKQLIIDVSNRDSGEYADMNRELGDKPKSWPEFYLTSKLYRFKESFNQFFDALQFENVVDQNEEKTIRFTKGGISIPIDNLSTGEKQIVFRGAHLLKNSGVLHGGAIFVDEPELSMHPKWQRKILAYYKGLFTADSDQIAQLFFATHSDHVVKAALRDDETIVITLERGEQGLIAKRHDAASVLPMITSAEANYRTFDLPSIDYHIELYGWLQEKESKLSVRSCDEFIAAHPLFNPAIHGRRSAFNATTYTTLSTFVRNAIHHPAQGTDFTEDELRTSIRLLTDILRHEP